MLSLKSLITLSLVTVTTKLFDFPKVGACRTYA